MNEPLLPPDLTAMSSSELLNRVIRSLIARASNNASTDKADELFIRSSCYFFQSLVSGILSSVIYNIETTDLILLICSFGAHVLSIYFSSMSVATMYLSTIAYQKEGSTTIVTEREEDSDSILLALQQNDNDAAIVQSSILCGLGAMFSVMMLLPIDSSWFSFLFYTCNAASWLLMMVVVESIRRQKRRDETWEEILTEGFSFWQKIYYPIDELYIARVFRTTACYISDDAKTKMTVKQSSLNAMKALASGIVCAYFVTIVNDMCWRWWYTDPFHTIFVLFTIYLGCFSFILFNNAIFSMNRMKTICLREYNASNAQQESSVEESWIVTLSWVTYNIGFTAHVMILSTTLSNQFVPSTWILLGTLWNGMTWFFMMLGEESARRRLDVGITCQQIMSEWTCLVADKRHDE